MHTLAVDTNEVDSISEDGVAPRPATNHVEAAVDCADAVVPVSAEEPVTTARAEDAVGAAESARQVGGVPPLDDRVSAGSG